MHINNTQQKHSYREFIENFSFLFEEIKDKNSLSNEIRKEDESVYNAVVGFNTVKFLTRHTNWNWDEDKNKNKAYKVIPLEWNKIKKTEQKFESEVKARLKEYVDDITGVSIYGDHASITLGDGKKEFKISEFLNSDFCQKKGISGFSTLHSDGKSGMHGFVAGEGGKKIRHYVVTDGSYEMTLNWHDKNGKKCTIKIKIDKDGVDLVERNGVTEEQLKANTDVKIGGLFLHEIKFREKGRVNEVQHDGKDNQVLNKSSEIAIKSNSRDIEQEVKKPVQKHQATHMNREFGSQTPPLPPLRTSSLPPKENVVNEQGRNASTKPVSQDGGQRDKQNNPTPNNQQQPKTQQQEGNSNNNLLQGIINARKNLQHTGIDGREASIERNKENNPWKKLKEELPYLPFSDMHEHNSDNQGASDAEWEETLSAPKPNRGVSSPTVDHSQSQSDPKHLNRKFEKNHQRENKAPEEHGRNSKSETHKTPITNQAIGELKAVLEKLDERVKEQAQQVNEENISKDQFSKNVLQKIEIAGKEDNQNLDLLKKNSKISQSDVVKKREDSSNKPLSTISTEENIDVDDTQLTRFTSKLNEETQKFSLKPVDQEEQTKEHLLATGLLKDNAAEREINDSGYSSPTYTSHYNFQVNPEQLEKRLETIEPKDTLEKLNKGLREPSHQATKDLFSENMLEKIKEGEKYDPVRKLLERKVAEQENDNTNLTIDKNSELYKLLEKDAAQLKAGVIEEEKETEYTGSPDRNRVALANKNRKLLWTKRIADKQEKNDGISI